MSTSLRALAVLLGLAAASLFGLGMYLGYRFDLEWDD